MSVGYSKCITSLSVQPVQALFYLCSELSDTSRRHNKRYYESGGSAFLLSWSFKSPQEGLNRVLNHSIIASLLNRSVLRHHRVSENLCRVDMVVFDPVPNSKPDRTSLKEDYEYQTHVHRNNYCFIL